MPPPTLGELLIRMFLDHRDFDSGADKVTKRAQRVGEVLGGMANGINTLVVGAFQAATAAVAGLSAASAVVGANFQQQMTQVGVIAGATAEELKAMTAKARELGATTSFSATEAAEAMTLLAGAGLETNQVLAASGAALNLAGAGGTTLDVAAESLTSTMSQFSLGASEAGRIADVFAASTAKSQFTVEDLGAALKYGGTVGAGFGLSLEETVASLALFRNAGLEGAKAGTTYRSAMVGAASANETNRKTLEKYGLTQKDISPETHSFADILKTVGEAGISTSDAMVIFGTEAGAVVKTLADQFAAGSTAYQDMLSELQTSTGRAASMYGQMSQTVSGAFASLQSAAEEVLLTLFDQYSGPLAGLLEAVSEMVTKIAEAVGAQSYKIKADLGLALNSLTTWIGENAGYIATSIAGFIADLARFSTGIQSLLPWLSALIPLLDDIAKLMATIWVATKVMAMATAIGEVVAMIQAASVAANGFAVALVGMTGGIYALIAGIYVLIGGLIALASGYAEATFAAHRLKEAQDKLNAAQAKATADRVAALQAYLDANQEAMKQEMAQLAASGEMQGARYRELQLLSQMTAATAAQKEAEGELVMVRGQLRTAASIAEELDPDTVKAFKDQVAGLSRESARTATQIATLEAALLKAREVDASMFGYEAMLQSIFSKAGISARSIEDAEVQLAALNEQQKQAAQAAQKLGTAYTDATNTMLAEAQRGADGEVRVVGRTVPEKVQLQRDYVDGTIALHEQLLRDLQGIGKSDEELAALAQAEKEQQVRDGYAKQIESARSYYAELIGQAKGNQGEQIRLQAEFEAEKLRLEQALQMDLVLVTELAARQKAEAELEAARKAAEDKRREEERVYEIIRGLENEGLSESERLQQEKTEVLAGIDDRYGAEKARIAALYDQKITDAQTEEEKKREDARKAALQAMRQQFADAARGVVDAFKSITSGIQDTLTGALDAAAGFIDFFASGLESLTGFSFNLVDAIEEVASTMQEAQESQVVMGDGEGMGVSSVSLAASSATMAAQQVIAGMVDAALLFVQTAVAAVPDLLNALIAGLPALIGALVEAIPQVAAALAAAIPGLVDLFVTEMPKVIEALVAAVPLLVGALVEAFPKIIDSLIGLIQSDLLTQLIDVIQTVIDVVIAEVPRLIVAIIQQIPALFSNILAHLPDVIKGLIAGLADIIVAIVEAIPDLVKSIIDALPDIIIALIDAIMAAIPQILMAVIEAIPQIITGIIGGIPEIFSAILSRIPTIITTLIGLVPDLILAIAQGLPDMIPVFIELIPQLIAAFLTYIPEIVIALVKSLVVELPKELWQMVPALGQAILDALMSVWDSLTEIIGNLFKAAWEAITSLFSKEGEGGSAYSGIDYVPATMRMTVHPGEAIIPASRNPMNRGGRADMALAGGRVPAGAFQGGGGQGSVQSIQLMMNGRVVEEVLLESTKMGHATGLQEKIRLAGGVKPGFDRGRYTRWNK